MGCYIAHFLIPSLFSFLILHRLRKRSVANFQVQGGPRPSEMKVRRTIYFLPPSPSLLFRRRLYRGSQKYTEFWIISTGAIGHGAPVKDGAPCQKSLV